MFQPFLCSTMATLPQGLLEIPSFNCTLNWAEKVTVVLHALSIVREVILYTKRTDTGEVTLSRVLISSSSA